MLVSQFTVQCSAVCCAHSTVWYRAGACIAPKPAFVLYTEMHWYYYKAGGCVRGSAAC
jgi:hypothetical protein